MENELKEVIINQVKDRRVLLDNLMQRLEPLCEIDSMQQAFYKIREAKAWSGELLKILDSPNPYPSSTDVKSTVIETRTESVNLEIDATFIADIFKDTDSLVSQVKATRLVLDKLIKDWGNFTSMVDSSLTLIPTKGEVDTVELLLIRVETVVDKLTECKHWCGWALNDIRENQQ